MASTPAISATGSHTGSKPDVSSLEFDTTGGTDLQDIDEPYKTTLTKKLGKQFKAAFPRAKFARIRGNAHQSSKAPEQGKVLSIHLLDKLGEKVVETIHVLANGSWNPGSQYYKDKRDAAKKK